MLILWIAQEQFCSISQAVRLRVPQCCTQPRISKMRYMYLRPEDELILEVELKEKLAEILELCVAESRQSANTDFDPSAMALEHRERVGTDPYATAGSREEARTWTPAPPASQRTLLSRESTLSRIRVLRPSKMQNGLKFSCKLNLLINMIGTWLKQSNRQLNVRFHSRGGRRRMAIWEQVMWKWESRALQVRLFVADPVH